MEIGEFTHKELYLQKRTYWCVTIIWFVLIIIKYYKSSNNYSKNEFDQSQTKEKVDFLGTIHVKVKELKCPVKLREVL